MIARIPILAALLGQLAGFATLWFLLSLGLVFHELAALALIGLVAAVVGQILGLARWWLPIQFVLPFVVAGALALALPSWLYLAGFLALVLVYWNAAGERVPLYLTNKRTCAALGEILPKAPASKVAPAVIDLGSGLGGTLFDLAGRHPGGRFVGVESAPLPFAGAWLRKRLTGASGVELRFASLWDQHLGDFDLVYCFLSPAPMARLFEKARGEMKPGSLFVSNSFTVPGHDPDEVRELDDSRRTKLLIWKMNSV